MKAASIDIVTGQGAQPQPEKHCNEKVGLVDEYTSAAEELSRTLNTLRLTMGALPKAEYGLMWNFIEKARKRTEAAHLALQRHIDEHGC
jgi:hypothetical protein